MLDEEPPRTGPGAGRWVGVVAVMGLVGSVISSSASSEKDWNFRSKNVIFLTFKKIQWVKKTRKILLNYILGAKIQITLQKI